jgi:hypothetical protein
MILTETAYPLAESTPGRKIPNWTTLGDISRCAPNCVHRKVIHKLRRRPRHRNARPRGHHQERQGRPRVELRIAGRRDSRAGVRLLGLRRHQRRFEGRRRSGRRDWRWRSPRRHSAKKPTSFWRPKRSTKRPGSRPAPSIPSRSRWIATSPRSWPSTANCAATRPSAWPKPPCISMRERQVFASTLGSLIDQTRTTSGAGFSATLLTRMAKSRSARTPIPSAASTS